MGDRRRNRGGRKLLIVVALGPFCAAAADLPVRALASHATRAGGVPVRGFLNGCMFSMARNPAAITLFALQDTVRSPMEWVELDLNANLLRRAPANSSPNSHDAGSSPGCELPGGDGNLLVYAEGGAGPLRLQWFAQPASKGP